MGILDKLSVDDNNLVDSTIFVEYGYLMTLSCLYPSLRSDKNILSVIQFIIYILLLICNIIALIITIYIAADDETILTQSLHFVILFSLSISIILSFNMYRPEVSRIHRDIGYGSFKYDDETHKCVDQIKKAINRKKKIILYGLPVFVGASGMVIIFIGPLADYFTGKQEDEIYSKGGVSLNLPVPCWTPFGSDTVVTFIASCFMEAAGHYVIVMLLTTANISIFIMVQHLSMELNLLGMALSRIHERANILYKNRYGNSHLHRIYLADCYKECIKENIIHHQKILRTTKDMNKMLTLCLSFGYFTGTIMIAISGVMLIFGSSHIGPLANAAFMGFTEVMELLFLCWCGEELTQASNHISHILYAVEWYNLNTDFNRMLNVMMLTSQKSLFLYFNSISNLPANLETFANLMNTAYSYFNLLYAFREETLDD